MKIAFIGKMASGKSSCCEYLQTIDMRFKTTNFAKMVKYIATNIFFMKNKDRVLLQKIGTKMREIRPNVFVDYIIHETTNETFYLLDDARYVNEIETLMQNGWILIKLEISKELQKKRLRSKYPDTFQHHLDRREHESEMEQNTVSNYIYHTIINVDEYPTMDSLYERLDELYKELS